MLSIFHTGGLTLGLTLFWFALTSWFVYQSIKAHKSGWEQLKQSGEYKTGDEKISYWKIPQVWFAIAVTVLYIVAMFFVASDYKGV